MVRLWRQRLLWKLLSAIELRKQCRLLVPFLFGEANPNPNLKFTWLATWHRSEFRQILLEIWVGSAATQI